MLRSVLTLAFGILLCTGPGVFANVIHYDAMDASAQSLCCNIAADRRVISLQEMTPKVDTEWSTPAQPGPAIDDLDARLHGPSWTFFLVAIMAFIAAKITLLFRPVHRASIAYARLYWDVFGPLEF